MKGNSTAVQVWVGTQDLLRARLSQSRKSHDPKRTVRTIFVYSTGRTNCFVWSSRPIDQLRIDALGIKLIDTWTFRLDGRPHLTVV